MSNPIKYIKDLEAAGLSRNLAEAHVQMVLNVLESELATKPDLAILKEHMDRKFQEVDHRFQEFDHKLNEFYGKSEIRFTEMGHRFRELELRLVVKLGFLVASAMTIGIPLLTWLFKLK